MFWKGKINYETKQMQILNIFALVKRKLKYYINKLECLSPASIQRVRQEAYPTVECLKSTSHPVSVREYLSTTVISYSVCPQQASQTEFLGMAGSLPQNWALERYFTLVGYGFSQRKLKYDSTKLECFSLAGLSGLA